MSDSTRDKFLQVAQTQFAESGFDGVSIAKIAEALDLSKQALLHHFSSKEKLYGEVLERISSAFESRLEQPGTASNDVQAIAETLVLFARNSISHRQETILIMRELLDNSERAGRANRWYLKDFVSQLIDRVHAHPDWQQADRSAAAATTYQLLGAINYFAVSQSTLRAMFGEAEYNAMENSFPDQLRELVIGTIERGPAKGAS